MVFRVTERPKVLGFVRSTEAEKYGWKSQVLICRRQAVSLCLRKKSCSGVSDAQQAARFGKPVKVEECFKVVVSEEAFVVI